MKKLLMITALAVGFLSLGGDVEAVVLRNNTFKPFTLSFPSTDGKWALTLHIKPKGFADLGCFALSKGGTVITHDSEVQNGPSTNIPKSPSGVVEAGPETNMYIIEVKGVPYPSTLNLIP
jgi:hypothetical protein